MDELLDLVRKLTGNKYIISIIIENKVWTYIFSGKPSISQFILEHKINVNDETIRIDAELPSLYEVIHQIIDELYGNDDNQTSQLNEGFEFLQKSEEYKNTKLGDEDIKKIYEYIYKHTYPQSSDIPFMIPKIRKLIHQSINFFIDPNIINNKSKNALQYLNTDMKGIQWGNINNELIQP